MTGSNLNKLLFKYTPYSSGKNLDREALRKLTTQIIEATQFIPSDLLTKVGQQITEGFEAPKGKASFKDMDEVARQIAQPVHQIQSAYLSYYKATLLAMDKVLANPQIPPSSKEVVHVTKTIPLHVGSEMLTPVTRNITVTENWDGLADPTMEQKKSGAYAKTFWKHTGEAYKAFHAEVVSKLASIRLKSFIDKTTVSEVVAAPSPVSMKGIGKRVVKANYTIALGVPRWNKRMDTLFTIPFASGQSVSTVTGSGLGSLFTEDKQQMKKLRGLDRILAAEAYRPWLRDIAAQAGEDLQSYLSGQTTKFASRSPLAIKMEQVRQQAAKAEKLKKAKADAADKAQKAKQAEANAYHKATKNAWGAVVTRQNNIVKRWRMAADKPKFEAAERAADARAREENAKIRKRNEKKAAKAHAEDLAIRAMTDKWQRKYGDKTTGLAVTEEQVGKAARRANTARAIKAAQDAQRSKDKSKKRAGSPKKPAPIIHHPGQNSPYKPINMKLMRALNPRDLALRLASLTKKRST